MSLIRSLDESSLESKSAAEIADMRAKIETYAKDIEAEEDNQQPVNKKFNFVKLANPSDKPTIIENKCAMDEIPHELQDLCLGYANDTDDIIYRYPRISFFNKIQALNKFILTEAAEHILWGRVEEALALVKDYPSILTEIIEAKDPLGRRVKGTLLQIATAAGDLNIKENLEEKDRGIVERLSVLMSPDEVIKQLAEQFRPGWEVLNEKRMQRYLKALETFAEEIINANIPTPAHWTLEAFQAAQAQCWPYIEKLREALKPDLNEIVTSGYIFDTQIFYRAAKLFKDRLEDFGDWWSLKSDLFWVNGFGSLQCDASARDAQVMRRGVGSVVDSDVVPERALKNGEEASDFFVSTSRLGLNFFLGYYGRTGENERGAGTEGGLRRDIFSELIASKTAAIGEILYNAKTIGLRCELSRVCKD